MPSTEASAKTELPPISSTATSSGLANNLPTAADLKEKQEKKEKSTLTFRKVFRSYLVPIGVLAIFGSMLIFLIIPKISDILAQLDQTNSAYDQAKQLDTNITSLVTLNTQQQIIQTNLATINSIAPSGATEVVNFQKKILDLAAADSLTVQQSSLEESVKKAEDAASSSSLGIIEIPSTFSLRGAFKNLQSFVQQINTLKDFVIIGEMALRANLDANVIVTGDGTSTLADDWTLIITLIKYQFITPNAQNQLATVFKNVPVTAVINQKVIDFANNKSVQNSQTTDTTSTTNTTDTQTTTDTSGTTTTP